MVVAAGAAVIAIGGCGSSPAASAATGKASDGCHQVLGVGQALERHTPASGVAIDHQLRQAVTNLDAAAKLDGHWSSLATALQQFVATIEAGQTPSADLVAQMTDGCRRFAGTSASNAN